MQLFTSVRHAGPTTVRCGAALETDWHWDRDRAQIQLQTGARRLSVFPLVKVRVTGADNSTQIRIGLRAGGRGNKTLVWSVQRDAEAFLHESSRTDTPKTDTPC